MSGLHIEAAYIFPQLLFANGFHEKATGADGRAAQIHPHWTQGLANHICALRAMRTTHLITVLRWPVAEARYACRLVWGHLICRLRAAAWTQIGSRQFLLQETATHSVIVHLIEVLQW